MRSTLILPAVLVMVATAAQASDRVVKATIYDEAQSPATSAAYTPARYITCRTIQDSPPEPSVLPSETSGMSCYGGCADAGCASSGCCASDGCANGCGNGACCDSSCGRRGRCGKGHCKNCDHSCAATLSGNGCCNVCNMPQHLPYDAVDHGYYYFRPYNYRHIRDHQEAVMTWGGDPRNPYANEMFQEIYKEMDEVDGLEPIQMPADSVPPAPISPTAAPYSPAIPAPVIDPAVQLQPSNQLRLLSHQR